MKTIVALLAMAAAAAAQAPRPASAPTPRQQAPGSAPETPSRGRLSAAPAKAAEPPSVKALKFGPLKPIPVPNVTTFTLPNGIKLFLLEDHELPLISGAARVRTGNLFDPRDKVGVATLTGMALRTGGTREKTGEQLDQELENIAASVESNIGESAGSVTFSALKENAPEVMRIFKDLLTAPEFRQDKIDLAKTQIRSSIARRNDDPGSITEREFPAIVYGKDSPYGWDIEYATVDRIARVDLQNFYRRYFFPGNTLLAVWGDFDTATMRAEIEKLFVDWTVSQPVVPPFPKVNAKPAPGTYLAAKPDVTQTFFTLGQLGGDLRDKDYAALEIMSDILGGGFQSRLVQRVRTKMGNAYNIGAGWAAQYDHPGLFEISGSTKALSTVETIQAIREEVERIRTTEVAEDELRSAKDTALNSLVFAFDTRTKTLGRMLTYEYFAYPKDFIQQYQKALAAVTRADVLRVAREHLRPEQFTLVAVGNPQDFGKPLDALGSTVNPIDLTIPAPKREAAESTAATREKGGQILARAREAAGGTARIEAVTDYTETADFQLGESAGGMQVKQTERWLAPGYFRQESVLPAGRIAVYSDGKSGWISTPQGSGALAGPQLQQVQGDLFRIYFRLLLSDRIPGRTVDALDDNTVEISGAAGESAQASFDPATGLLRAVRYQSVTQQGPPAQVEDSVSDFREVGGVKVPHKIAIAQGGARFADVAVTDLKINTGLKPEELAKRP